MKQDNYAATVAVVACDNYDAPLLAQRVAAAFRLVGGLEAYVRPGQTVLIKPNLLSPRDPQEAVTTHPALVAAVIQQCFAAGAARVWVGDSCAGDHADAVLWEKTGMCQAVAGTAAELVSFNAGKMPRRCGNTHVPVPDWLAKVDQIISLPKLKTHSLTVMTGAIKNTYGLICGNAKAMYHASYPSPRMLSRFLMTVYAELKPGLVLMDAITAMEGDGPANGDPVNVGLLLAGADAVAVDVICARLWGYTVNQVPTLKAARQCGAGTVDERLIAVTGDGISRLNQRQLRHSIGRVLQWIPEPVFKLATYILACRPQIDQQLCVRCGVCERICSQRAIIRAADGGPFMVKSADCILCMCCAESCPQHAIVVNSPVEWYRRWRARRPASAGTSRNHGMPK